MCIQLYMMPCSSVTYNGTPVSEYTIFAVSMVTSVLVVAESNDKITFLEMYCSMNIPSTPQRRCSLRKRQLRLEHLSSVSRNMPCQSQGLHEPEPSPAR